MGTEGAEGFPADGESPVSEVIMSPFAIGAATVTNVALAVFAKKTGYVTDAERYWWSYVFHPLLSSEAAEQDDSSIADAPWRIALAGADWRHPDGPGSEVAKRANHPVAHVSWYEYYAQAYYAWAGTRLPAEAEWKHAARGGLQGARFTWRRRVDPHGRAPGERLVWQGRFPDVNTAEDSYLGTAPVWTYRPNGYKLYNMAGKVWDWCAENWSVTFHIDGPRRGPTGPPTGESRVVRCGSHLCHESSCNGHRVAARTSNTPTASAVTPASLRGPTTAVKIRSTESV